MVKAATMVGLLFVAAASIHCSPFGGASEFACTDDVQCQAQGGAGRCETTGFCSFPDESCGPGGSRYGELAGGLSNQCVNGEPPPDGPEPDPDGPPPDPEDECFGTDGGLNKPCFAPADLPAAPVSFAANTTIDTDTSPQCSTVVKNSTACVIAGTTVTINAGVTLRAVGGKPLVLVATTGVVQINGAIDVAGHLAQPLEIPAAGNDATCEPGTAPGTSSGGAGGSHGALGGNGGDGAGAGVGGVPGAATAALATLRGGCKAQNGQQGAGTAGVGGNGGGAVYVIGKTGIAIGAGAQINASGAGGTGGNNGSAGGGGGGSGGTIGLDTPVLTNGGQIFANGGGGGAGAGSSSTGGPGGDATFAGGTAGVPGGNGSAGGAGGTSAAGSPGAPSPTRGAGGGGGSTGIIKLFGGATANGQISPGPT